MTKELAKYGTHTVEDVILAVRGRRVILDADLARIYGVTTKALNQAVKRNIERFPADFVFQLTAGEAASLRSQTVTLKAGRGQHRKYPPWAFTEHGAVMAATILNSSRAVAMSVYVVRAFVRMRRVLAGQRGLARELAELEQKLTARLDAHETAIVNVLRRVLELLDPPEESTPEPPPRKIGFGVREPRARYLTGRRGR